MRSPLPLTWLGLSAQLPLQAPFSGDTQIRFERIEQERATQVPMAETKSVEFAFNESPGVFAPKDLIELGRPGAGVANDIGDLVLIPYSQFSFKEKKNTKSIWIASLEGHGKPIQQVLEKSGETFWLNSRTIGHVADGELYAHSLESSSSGPSLSLSSSPIFSFPTKSSANFVYNAASGYLVFSDYVYEDGNLTEVKKKDEEWEERGTTALVYDRTYVRHWDTWNGKKKSSLFSVRLGEVSGRKWKKEGSYTNLLVGTKHNSPVEPFGGTDDFDVSATHVVYTTIDPKSPEAWHTKQNVYIVPITGGEARELTSGQQGATHNPTFNANGTKVAWVELTEDGYEADRGKIVIYDLEVDVRYTLAQGWDRSASGLAFSKSGDFLYILAGDAARVKVFTIPVPTTPSASTTHPILAPKFNIPVAITHTGAASGLQTLPGNKIIFSQSSFTSPNDVYLVKDLEKLEKEILEGDAVVTFNGQVEKITRLTHTQLAGAGKVLSEGESFYFTGADNFTIQGWAIKPPSFVSASSDASQTKKYPVVLLIHGGPQSAWEDQWSTRWNPNVFAQQGYFVLALNPTGSTTFGQEITDRITEDWGGRPFVDLIAGWKAALQKWPEIDPERAVAAGASWGGYAINWIQGHPEFGFNFKALICHDGVFDSKYNAYATDEVFFFNHDWGSRPWEPKFISLAQKYSPSNFVHKWSTPQLIFHGSKDYRIPETEGIAAFHALQQLGIPSRLVVFPDENHWVLNHGNSLKWHYEAFRWFDKFVGEKPSAGDRN